MKAQKVRVQVLNRRIWYICPKCGKPLVYIKKRLGRNKCNLCGQELDWEGKDEIPSVWILALNSEEAAYWAEQYESMHGDLYGINVTQFLKNQRKYPLALYFSFPDGTGYGRFMRLASKEKAIIRDITTI